MTEGVSNERLQLLADVANMYFMDELSQKEIAKRVGLSRSMISYLLRDARRLGIVEITINRPVPRALHLEQEIMRLFPLKRVMVLERKTSDDVEIMRTLGFGATQILEEELQDGMIFGLGWGNAIRNLVQAMRPRRLPEVKVVQLTGGVGSPNRSVDGAEQCRRAADRLGAQPYNLNAPLVVENDAIAIALRQDRTIHEVLQLASHANVAAIGIGSIIPEISTQFHAGYITSNDLKQLEELGIVGDMCLSYFNLQGEHVPIPWIDARMIGIRWEQLKQIEILIGIAGGKRKAASVLGALRSGFLDILITDDRAADEALRLQQ